MEKSFNKHYLEKNPSSGRVEVDSDGRPVIGKLLKADCRLEQRHVNILNRGWKRSGVYYVSSKEQDEANRKAEEAKRRRLEFENQATEAGKVIESQSKENEVLKKATEAKDAEIEELRRELASKSKPIDVVKSTSRIKLEGEAKELNINFRADISDEKLIERINEKKK